MLDYRKVDLKGASLGAAASWPLGREGVFALPGCTMGGSGRTLEIQKRASDGVWFLNVVDCILDVINPEFFNNFLTLIP